LRTTRVKRGASTQTSCGVGRYPKPYSTRTRDHPEDEAAVTEPIIIVTDTLAASIAHLPVAGIVFELDGTIVATNAAAGRLLGSVTGKAWDVVPALREAWEDLVLRIREAGTASTTVELDARTLDFTFASRDDGRTLGIAIDVTHHCIVGEAKTRADLDNTQRLESLGLVAGGIAHEFNNQLVIVLAEATSAREDESLPETTRDALRRIEASAKRMAQLTRQLLAYAGRGRFVTELTDADQLLDGMRDQLAKLVREGATLEITPNSGTLAIEADRNLLRQVIVNLVANASDALRDTGGAITVASRVVVRNTSSWWQLEIRDTGAGMDARTLARIFDPFFTTKSDRHGLGLSAVHGIVRRFGGDLDVDSSPGKGTTFRVRLPIVPGAEPKRKRTKSSKQPPVSSLSGMRVLVADDEASVRATVKRLLERRGATVVTASDGTEAEARLRDGDFGLVLLDVMMPGANGYELVPIARATQPATPVMLMSGYTEQERGTGADEPDLFLEKPFTTKTLDAAIEDLLKNQS
jgi:signal transduction histidine kinase